VYEALSYYLKTAGLAEKRLSCARLLLRILEERRRKPHPFAI
jgi:hypothetical protein